MANEPDSDSAVGGSSTDGGGPSSGGGVTGFDVPTGTTTGEPEVTSTGSTAALGETLEGAESTSTSEDTGRADTTTGSSSGTDTSGGDSDGDSSSTGAGDTTTGDGDGGGFDCCEPGCKHMLVQGHPYSADVIVSGDRLVSHDAADKTILWDRVTHEPVRVEYGWNSAYLEGDLFALSGQGVFRWFDATDGAVLGESNEVGQARGLATDGSYLWQATAAGLKALALDGAELWFQPGNFGSGRVHGVPGLLLASSVGLGTLVAIDLNTDTVQQIPIQGDVAMWWSDGSGRFATAQGQAYRVYEPDGTQLAAGIGWVSIGHGDLFVTGGVDVRSVLAPNQILQSLPPPDRISRNAMMYDDLQQPRIVALEQDQVVDTLLQPFTKLVTNFAYDAGTWVFSGDLGYLTESTGEEYTLGQFAHLDASRSGRIVAASKFGATHVWDIAGNCGVKKTGAFARLARPMTVADGGDVLVAADGAGMVTGVGFLTLPDGAPIGVIPGGKEEMTLRASEDASLFSRRWVWNGDESSVLTFPAGEKWFESQGSFPTYVSPDGQHAALTEPWQVYWNPEKGYVYGAGGLVSVFDGVIYGFLDDERLIRGKHVKSGCGGLLCFPFLGADIVTLDGAVVQATTLPEVPGFQRISATELLVEGPPRIYDAYTGELLWSLPEATLAAAVGEDFVVTSDRGELIVHKWR